MHNLDTSFQWRGRQDSEDGENGFRWHHKFNAISDTHDLSILGFACDLGVIANKGRKGAKDGPNAIRHALANLAWHSHLTIEDLGNVVAGDSLADSQDLFAKTVKRCLNNQQFVIGLGGGHEIAWASYNGLFESNKKNSGTIGIINFDAHFDLRKPAPHNSSGTPFFQIAEHCKTHSKPFHYACLGVAESANTQALFTRAEQLKVISLKDFNFSAENAKTALTPMLQQVDQLYVTICLDGFSADQAPGVSAPSAFGIDLAAVIDVLKWLAQSQQRYDYQWQLADIAEMNPHFDVDNRTAKLAARLIFEIVKVQSSKP
ncbi:formimidoylglutamase [Aliiglaciecola sp. LCG003]|uniref:formimidoylglutamase n=1 Tax=Aliiglaciecola sp. LCG003 TaxID=3053655 RepID=UPI0025722E26|nr:formimidoylglutamase [Aliiglaciecola sp. LCG003]WJG10723.1 formimidoylglutamase [Aliiglaciecola sp. LCG003]